MAHPYHPYTTSSTVPPPSLPQQQQQWYRCISCTKQYDKQAYNDHMVCQYKCEQLIKRAYDDARQENVALRKKFSEIGEQVNVRLSQKETEIDVWKSRLQDAQMETQRTRQELEAKERECLVIAERQNARIVETASLQRTIEELKLKHTAEIQRLSNKHSVEMCSTTSEWTRRLEKAKADEDTIRAEAEVERNAMRISLEEQARQAKDELIAEHNAKIAHLTLLWNTEKAELQDTVKRMTKQRHDESQEHDASLRQAQQQVCAYRKKVEELSERVHVLEMAAMESKQEGLKEKDELRSSYTKQIDDMYTKLKQLSAQNGALQSTLEQEQKRLVQEQQTWTQERDQLQSQIMQCRTKHMGQTTLYTDLLERLDQIQSTLHSSLNKKIE